MMPPGPGPRARPAQPATQRRPRMAATLEDQVRNAYFVPSPTTYSALNSHSQDLVEPKALGKISGSVHPSPLDHAAKAKAFVPGPGSYSTPDTQPFALPEGGRVSRKAPTQRFKPFDEYPMPGPGHVGIPNDPARPRQVSGAFSKEKRVSKYIEDGIQRSR